ncbi:MAG TPA: hypothetical protein VIU93_11510 [Gallionellaceae bacterium]
MSRRYAAYLALIALLVAVNAVRWMHGMPWDTRNSAATEAYAEEDFRLHAGQPAALNASRRNLFEPAGRASGVAPKQIKPAAKAAPVQVAAPSPTMDTDGAGLAKLKLLGVVFRAGAGQAYLAQDRESVLVHNGDTAFGRFAVEQILVDAVDLRDIKTNLSRRIPVSGK